jgi:hypothetical protein
MTLRTTYNIELSSGDGMAKGLYNLYNHDTGEVTLWFDKDTAEELKTVSDIEYINYFNDNKR